MADDRPSPVVVEARALAAAAGGADGAAPVSSGPDVVLSALGARAAVDSFEPTGRLRVAKRGVLKVAQLFLRDQAIFNQLTVSALREMSERLEQLEARLTALEAVRATSTAREPGGAES